MHYHISRYSEQEILDNEDSIYSLPAWKQVSETDVKPDAEHYRLTTFGEDYVDDYQHDYSAGYDLCYGRMRGLAAIYNMEQFWDIVTDKSKPYITAYDTDDQLRDKLQVMCCLTFTDLYWREDGVLAYVVPDADRLPSDLLTLIADLDLVIDRTPTVRLIDDIETNTYTISKK